MTTQKMLNKLRVSQASVDLCGQKFKHLVISLTGEQSIVGVLQDPDIWTAIQSDRMLHLSKGDRVTVVSPDGLVLAESAMCVKAEAGRCWFGKPLRTVALEETPLFEDGKHRVVAVGTSYSVASIRDGRVEDRLYSSAKAAESEILRRAPVQVAS